MQPPLATHHTASYPWTTATSDDGERVFRAFADATGAKAESDETNNQSTLGYHVSKKPDVTVSSITLDPTDSFDELHIQRGGCQYDSSNCNFVSF